MNNWKKQFSQIENIDKSERFNSYKVRKNGNTYFAKEVTEETDDWSKKSVNKEYEIYTRLNLTDYETPSVKFYEPSKILCTDWVQEENWDIESFADERYVNELITDLVLLLNNLQEHDWIEPELRWPNTEEFYYRMTAEVNFNKEAFTELIPVLERVKENAMGLVEKHDPNRTLVHGDLFYPNIVFNSSGLVNTLIDWEIAGWFDPMYDVAFVEANLIDIIAKSTENQSRSELLEQFRCQLHLDQNQIKRLNLYKLWPYYVNLAAVDKLQSPPNYSPFENRSKAINILYELFVETLSETDIEKKVPQLPELNEY